MSKRKTLLDEMDENYWKRLLLESPEKLVERLKEAAKDDHAQLVQIEEILAQLAGARKSQGKAERDRGGSKRIIAKMNSRIARYEAEVSQRDRTIDRLIELSSTKALPWFRLSLCAMAVVVLASGWIFFVIYQAAAAASGGAS